MKTFKNEIQRRFLQIREVRQWYKSNFADQNSDSSEAYLEAQRAVSKILNQAYTPEQKKEVIRTDENLQNGNVEFITIDIAILIASNFWGNSYQFNIVDTNISMGINNKNVSYTASLIYPDFIDLNRQRNQSIVYADTSAPYEKLGKNVAYSATALLDESINTLSFKKLVKMILGVTAFAGINKKNNYTIPPFSSEKMLKSLDNNLKMLSDGIFKIPQQLPSQQPSSQQLPSQQPPVPKQLDQQLPAQQLPVKKEYNLNW